ncbi:MAG TPA: OmpA family protein [Polyangiaceae bacterium]|jgi:chemotaxis protein MotB|nr:OmpA family protein [Polyangiaceae bacterium]
MRTHLLLGCALALATSACVSTGKYDAALADAASVKAALASQRKETARLAAEKAADQVSSQRELDEATAVNQQLHAELIRLGADADQLLAAKGALEQARARLEELRKAQAAAEARSALFRELAVKLKRMIDAGDLQITLRSGRMVLVLPNDVLFDSGKASLKPNGRETLELVAAALATIQGRRFQVSGHTDNEPIRFSGFASNWQLSSERALAVVGLLMQAGMRAQTLSAAGYGEFDPVAENDTPDNKARNRRTEIVLQPNIDELVAIPQTQK